MEYEEGDIVSGTVDKIVGTTVFVKLDGNGEGSIVFSEIAPGRIRNIRDYVVPKKRIVCKVLRISGSNIELSFRRVTQEERKRKLEEINQEKSYEGIIKSILKEKSSEIIPKIREKSNLYDFFEESKENPGILKDYFSKNEADKIIEILSSSKTKTSILKRKVSLFSKQPQGISLIKDFFNSFKEVSPKYISAGKYSIEIEGSSTKEAGQKLKKIEIDMEKEAKKRHLEFSISEK